MKPLWLRDQHQQRGAVFCEAAGWEVPAHYGDPIAEHAAVRKGVGLADLSHRGKVRLTGEDRAKWLQGIISNDILPLTPGHGCYASILTHKGKMLSYFRVYMLASAIMVEDVGEIGDVTFRSFRKFLLYGTKAKLENCGETWGLLLVSGPKADHLLSAAFRSDMEQLKPLSFLIQEIAGRSVLVIKTEETGETDFELLLPAETMVEAWNQLWKAGEPLGLVPFGTEARNILRLEAGLPVAGIDLDADLVPPEANLEGKAFSLSKGCYPGQEVLARMDTYGNVRRRLVGLVLPDQVLPPKHAKLFSEDREVGWITSSAQSPILKAGIAFGFPLRDFTRPGISLTVEVGGKRHTATVHALPFYKPGR